MGLPENLTSPARYRQTYMNPTSQYLYLDFEKFRPQLEQQLRDIRQLHRDQLFPTLNIKTNILDYFRETLFPPKEVGTYFISNTSLRENAFDITVRSQRTDIINSEFPADITLCIRGALAPQGHPSPAISVDRIVDVSETPARGFEIEVQAIAKPAERNRANNAINTRLLKQLPAISHETRRNLHHWQEYLQWKRAIVESQLAGLRYITHIVKDKKLCLIAIAENEEAFQSFERILRKEEVMAFPLHYSTDQWQFRYNKNARSIPAVPVGAFRECHKQPPARFNEELRDCPWDDPFVVELVFAIGEESGNREKRSNSYLIDKLPSAGYVATSLFGEFALLKRHASAIMQLEAQSGYAPFLSSWLFDISAANTPQISPPIDSWLMDNINGDQQKAIKKILGAPDVALIQGPPGTGKTTVIGEAIYQLTRQGKKVLLASQANLAVDNALEKLAAVPEIRAIRLGRSRKFSAGGQRFAEDRVLKRFYESIADACENRYLNDWRDSDAKMESLQKQLRDLANMEETTEALDQDIESLGHDAPDEEYDTVEEAPPALSEREQQMVDLRKNLQLLVQFLEGDKSVEPDIPEKFVDLLERTIIVDLERLKRFKIELGNHKQADKNNPIEDRISHFRQLYQKWINLRGKIPRLESEISRLSRAGNRADIAPENRLLVDQFHRQIDEIELLLESGDNSRLDEWHQLRNKIQQLRDQSTLNPHLYSSFFTLEENGKAFWKRLVNPRLDVKKLIAILKHAVKALRDTEKRIDRSVALMIVNLNSLIAKIPVVELPAVEEAQPEPPIAPVPEADLKTASLRKDILGKIEALDQERRKDAQFRNRWEPLLDKWVTMLGSEAQLKTDNQYFIDTYIANCNVVGITCNENRRLIESKKFANFDVTIIDEVSKATPPELLMPMMAAKKSILVGDHRQLPPLFQERQNSWQEIIEEAHAGDQDDPAYHLLTEENFLKFRDMVTASLFKKHFEEAPGSIKSMLETQYRMHPEIMEVVNHFYEHRLRCGLVDPDQERNHQLVIKSADRLELITPGSHAVWIDSSRAPDGKAHYETQSGTSKVNILEAVLIAEMLKRIDNACKKAGYDEGRKKDVGVIAFYGRQVAEIRKRVRNLTLKYLEVDVNTVDQFQGKENSIILISLVRNTRSRVYGNKSFVAQFERINVGFSRARELLVIFGAKDMFAECEVEIPQMDGSGTIKRKVYGDIIDTINRRANFWDSSNLLTRDQYQKFAGRR